MPTTKHGKKCVFESGNPTYVLMPVGTGEERGDQGECEGFAGGYCLCLTIFPFPVGIFLWGGYKQEVWGCEKWEIPDHCCLPLSPAPHQPAESWLPAFFGLPVGCFEGKLVSTAHLVLGSHVGWAHRQTENILGTNSAQCSQKPVL